jgi:hypothetical protein
MSFDLKIENNDLAINPDGSIQTVRDNAKLSQDIIKAILTPIGSNKFFTWYGSEVGSRTIGQAFDMTLNKIEIERTIQDTLSNIITLQQAQERYQYVSGGELIAAIKEISVLRDPNDPRQLQITVSVLTRKLTVVEETFTLTV